MTQDETIKFQAAEIEKLKDIANDHLREIYERERAKDALLRQALEALEQITKHFGIKRLGESTYKDSDTRCKAHESMNAIKQHLGEV